MYRGKDCMRKSITSLREHAANVIDIVKKKILPLTKKRAKVTQRYDKMLHLWKKILKNFGY